MKKNKIFLLVALLATITLNSCKDYLTETEPGTTMLNEFFTSTGAAKQSVTGCYVPLMWEYNNTYLSEWFFGDIVSDDALKGGGSTTDMSDAYDLENWRTESTNTLLLDFYRAQYIGIARCNMAISKIESMEVGVDDNFTKSMKARLLGEAHYLRAYYYFRLLRIYGGVPLTTDVIDDSENWGIGRASVSDVYNQIVADLEIANSGLWLKSKYASEDLGRATKGAAQAMLLKVNLYMASPYWQTYSLSKSSAEYYSTAKAWGDSIINSGEYALLPDSLYESQFTVDGENGKESVFEIQYAEVSWGDYGEGFGFTAGSFTPILMRSRSSLIGGGWGFDHPTQNLYDEFETADSIRRDVAILIPEKSLMENDAEEYYLENCMLNNKYGMYRDSTYGGGFGTWGLHASRGPLNNMQIRYSDVLLMYAEAALGAGDNTTAQDALNTVRRRMKLAEYPGYSFAVNGTTISTPTLEQAIKHERRCELAMEGHRWFDIVRWNGVEGNGVKAHMDAYKAVESAEVQSHIQEFVAGKHEIFPIPYEEILLNPTHMEQNPNY